MSKIIPRMKHRTVGPRKGNGACAPKVGKSRRADKLRDNPESVDPLMVPIEDRVKFVNVSEDK